MKAKITFYNTPTEEEINKAENLNMPIPETTIDRKADIYIDIELIHMAYINSEGDIVVVLPSGSWILDYDEDVWFKIKDSLLKR